jgi:autotransporter-associated beta strand protein
LSILSGTVTLGGSNTYTGGTTITQGTLRAGSATALPSGKDLTLSGTFDVGGYAPTFGRLSGTGTVTNSGTAATTLTLNSSNANQTFSGLLQDGNAPLCLVKSGGGTLTIARPAGNAYSGGTTLAGGVLVLANTGNSALGSGDVLVQSGGTLSGSGSLQLGIGKTVAVATGGVLAPGVTKGNAIEGLVFNAPINLADNAVAHIDIRGNNGASDVLQAVYHDYLQITAGDLHLGGVSDPGYGQPLLELALSGTHSPGEYIKILDLFDSGSRLYGEFRNFSQNQSWYDAGTGFTWWLLYRVDYNPTTGSLIGGNDVILTNVPEPSTIAMLVGGACLGLGALAWRRRGQAAAQYDLAKPPDSCYAEVVDPAEEI